jgi:hypothetical protein
MFTIPKVNQLPVIGEKQNVEPFDLNSKSFGKEQLLFTNTCTTLYDNVSH